MMQDVLFVNGLSISADSHLVELLKLDWPAGPRKYLHTFDFSNPQQLAGEVGSDILVLICKPGTPGDDTPQLP